MAVSANGQDQKTQAVLHALGYNLGPDGVDGVKGKNTEYAMRQFAISHGVPLNDMAAIQKAITDKLKDPAFRQRTLDALERQPQTRDNIVATKWVLEAAGHPTLGMKDQYGLMTGKMDARTQYALEHTAGGNVDATVVAAAVPDRGARDIVLASKNIPPVNNSFASASVGENRVAQAPEAKPVPVQRFDM